MNRKNYGPDLYSINPLLPCSEFVPDGEPHIFGDRIYVYGSHDLYNSGQMCQGDYVCYSADAKHPVTWDYEGVIYRRIQDPYVKKQLDVGKAGMMNANMFAPDVVEIEGKYYLYYGIGISNSGFGVAAADSPVGPYTYIGRVRYPESEKPQNWKDGQDGIDDGDLAFGKGIPAFSGKPGRGFGIHIKHYPYDPGVIYDNGRLFLYYGLGFCRVVELDVRDKRTVLKNERTGRYESDVLVPSFLPSSDGGSKKATGGMGMVNAPSIRKIDGKFCLTYYAMGPHHANAMCYALADSPFGPFTYRGTLVSLGNALYQGQKEPTDYVGNTHGGMVQVGNTWYTIYHRQTGNRSCGRQICAAALQRTDDGGFEHAEYASTAFSGQTVPAYHCWPGFMACYLTDAKGRTRKNSKSPYIALVDFKGGDIDLHTGKEVLQVVTNWTPGSVVGFKQFDFTWEDGRPPQTPEITLTMRVLCNGSVEIYIDDLEPRHRISTVAVEAEPGWQEFTAACSRISGIHAVYMVAHCKENQLGDLAFFEFS